MGGWFSYGLISGGHFNIQIDYDDPDLKQPKIHMKIHTSQWILKISRKKSANQKSRDFCQIFVIYREKPIGMDLKIFRKSI
jgi:hypothetical protein